MSAAWPLGGSVVFAVMAAYFAFVRRPTARRRAFRAAFAIACALLAVTGYGAWREHRALRDLAAVVSPFPGIETARWVPTFGSERLWVFHAPAQPGDVRRFYSEPRHHRGWTLVRESDDLLVLRNGDATLTLVLTDDSSTGGSVLTYSLQGRRER